MPVVVALIGAALVALSVPHLIAGIATAPFDEAVRSLGRGAELDDKTMRLARGSREHAMRLTGEGRYFAEAAALRFTTLQQEADRSGVAWRDDLDTVIAAHRTALERAPSQPFLWNRLALAATLRDGYGPLVADALRMSLATGRYEPRLVLPRLELALPAWNRLPAVLQSEFGDQIVLAMRWDPDGLVALTHRTWRLAETRAALAVEPRLRARFNLLYERRR